MKIKDLRKMNKNELEQQLNDLKLELMKEMGNVEMGGNIKNPGKIKVIRKDIARLMGLKSEREQKK